MSKPGRPTLNLVAGLVLAVLPLTPAGAQSAGANATPAMLRDEYLHNMTEVESKVMGLAEAFSEAQYAWRPAPGVRSVSETLMHIVSEHIAYLPQALGATPPADLNMGSGRELIQNLEKVQGKEAVLAHLRRSFGWQRSVLEGADAKLAPGRLTAFGQEQSVARFLNVFLADQHEHLGQLIAYARMNGVVPPWSRRGS